MVNNIYITGFMGSGKTTVGQALAKSLGYQVTDTDKWIEEMEGQSISTIFKQYGEPYFRDLETNALQQISGNQLIITTGGGIIMRPENREIMKEKGEIIYLQCDLEEVFLRLNDDTTRPLLEKEDKSNVEKLYQSRLPFYEEADYTINTTGKSIHFIVQELKSLLK
ncbi:shikimate kinase [Bacillus suaedae]|uniref:Shikimate kinase n=1 Tax=Halalkalibacter suaedae TaxID=2822140 RepID=A0A940WTS7_9BACI|nr:shikimate kinase [Bacillus suaedae]MBP3952340.1 shikimate kinase [Bacillus suaedae]